MKSKCINAVFVMLIITSSLYSQKKLRSAIMAEDTIALQKLVKGTKLYKEYGSYKQTPMLIACIKGKAKVVKFLLNQGYDVNFQNSKYGETALHNAIEFEKKEVTKLLLKHKADPNIKDNKGKTPFMIASGYPDLEVIKMLVDNGANISEKDPLGRSALMKAIEEGKIEIIEFFLNNEQNFDDEDNEKWTPLMYACRYSTATIVEKIINKGADITKKNKDGQTALALAVNSSNDFFGVKFLSSWGTASQKWDSYLQFSMKRFNKVIIDLIKSLKMKYDIEPFKFTGNNEFGYMYWLYKNNGKKHEFEIWLKNAQEVVDADNSKKIELLLQKGALVDSKTENGKTPLLASVSLCQNKICKLLVENKADPSISNKDGISPYKLALFTGNDELLKNLESFSEANKKVYNSYRHPSKGKCLIYISRDKTFKSSITPYKLVYANYEYVADINPGEYITIEVDPGIFTIFVSAVTYYVNAQAGSVVCLSWGELLKSLEPIDILPKLQNKKNSGNYRMVRKPSGGHMVRKIQSGKK